ncbi:MAG: hypothetical protein LBG87_00360 [Spirochaetaceae bacterium]|jgi:hypothetical protein|nr:hypothetical protein [Spirochaetaceae bacterium]
MPAQKLSSIEEFYKGIVYVFLYASLHKTDITDMSLSVLVTKTSAAARRYIRDVAWRLAWKKRRKRGEKPGGPLRLLETCS